MFYPKLEGLSLVAHEKAVDKLQMQAQKELRLESRFLVTRSLRPEDLGITGYWYFNVTSTSGWHTMVNAATIAQNRFITIEGVMYPKSGTQLITQLEIKRAESTVRYWTIQGVNFLENCLLFFDDPLTLGQNQPITIKGYNPSTTTNSAEEVVFIGSVVEKRGITVND